MGNINDIISKLKIVPVVKINDSLKAVPLAKALCLGGINICEITLRTPCALDAIKNISDNVKEMHVGAGTVTNLDQAIKAIECGAEFIVSPGFDEEICSYCVRNNIPVFPGCVTCSEIMAALKLGINIVKFFPSEAFGGIKTIKAISEPFSNVKFMPTGGINLTNLNTYLAHPSVIACGGSFIAKASMIDNSDFDLITQIAKETLKVIESTTKA